MCILIHTAKKNMLSKPELQQAMKKNSSGFFIAELLPKGKRNVLRTMSRYEAENFWEKIPDEANVVMHFRVPSRGGYSLENVHGWERDRILFGHNRTLFNLIPLMEEDKWTKTDSEYFFRKMFIPLYSKLGGHGRAYKDGKMCPMLDHFVRAVCGDYNKFMFVMPDNAVLKFGDWEGNDESRPGFFASNMSYKDMDNSTFFGRIKDWFNKGK